MNLENMGLSKEDWAPKDTYYVTPWTRRTKTGKTERHCFGAHTQMSRQQGKERMSFHQRQSSGFLQGGGEGRMRGLWVGWGPEGFGSVASVPPCSGGDMGVCFLITRWHLYVWYTFQYEYYVSQQNIQNFQTKQKDKDYLLGGDPRPSSPEFKAESFKDPTEQEFSMQEKRANAKTSAVTWGLGLPFRWQRKHQHQRYSVLRPQQARTLGSMFMFLIANPYNSTRCNH